MPSGLSSSEVSFYCYGNGVGTNTKEVQVSVAPITLSKDVTVTAPDSGFGTTQGADINIFSKDAFNRELITIMIAP